mmetsp:Transcript_45808/g.132648  ORF Transcript_45808/g.132648 Transcript_45808/m.132648 type:complete len:205 (-) Transcript_45808:535-1149(-)
MRGHRQQVRARPRELLHVQPLPPPHRPGPGRLRHRHGALRLRAPARRRALRQPRVGRRRRGGRALQRRPLPPGRRGPLRVPERDVPSAGPVLRGPRVQPGHRLRRGAAEARGLALRRRQPRHARRPLHRGALRGRPQPGAAVQRARPLRGPAAPGRRPAAPLAALLCRRARSGGLQGTVQRRCGVPGLLVRLHDLQHLRDRAPS